MKVDFSKYSDGLAPAIIQDYKTQKVLMLGFMNAEALEKTMSGGKFIRERIPAGVKKITMKIFFFISRTLLLCAERFRPRNHMSRNCSPKG